jgi:hypothetical protein
MNCREFQSLVVDLARDAMMDAGTLRSGLAHVESCHECDARLTEERSLTSVLHIAAKGLSVSEAPTRVESALLREFRKAAMASLGSEIARRRVRVRAYMGWGLAAAAVLLLILIPLAWRIHLKSQQVSPVGATSPHGPEPKETATVAPDPTDTPVPESGPRHNRKSPEYVAGLTSRSRRRVGSGAVSKASPNPEPAGNPLNAEIATDFMPLSFGMDQTTLSGARIVRVELPRSALLNFGLPVNMEKSEERVKADVVVGEDGLAHAIRFVR